MMCHVLRADVSTTGSKAMVPSCRIPGPSFSTIVRRLESSSGGGVRQTHRVGRLVELVMVAISDQEREVLVLYRKRSGEGIFGEREKHERRSVFDTAT